MKWVKTEYGGAVNMERVFSVGIVSFSGTYLVRAYSGGGVDSDVGESFFENLKECENHEEAETYVDTLLKQLEN